jgi:adenine-specific DNA-methyltransferase
MYNAGHWKRGRVVEGSSLENCRRGNPFVSSNLTASARACWTRAPHDGAFFRLLIPDRCDRLIGTASVDVSPANDERLEQIATAHVLALYNTWHSSLLHKYSVSLNSRSRIYEKCDKRNVMFRYFGSKASTSSKVADLVAELAPEGKIADAFGGLGTIGAELRKRGHHVTTCDVLTFPHYFQVSRIECKRVPSFKPLLAKIGLDNPAQLLCFLSKKRAPRSWFVKEYATERKFFTTSNAIKIAGVWHQIVKWNEESLINPRERAFLVSSLLNSMDRVANTAGTYYAHLKEFDRKSLKDFEFAWIPVAVGRFVGRAYLGDALTELRGKNFELLYLDPPYNERNYAGYYHLPESLAKLTKPTIRTGSASGIPVAPHPGAEFIRSGMTLEYLELLIMNVGWNSLVVHYCEDGLIPLSDLSTSLKRFGVVRQVKMNALGYTTRKIERSIYHHVFIVTKFETIASRRSLTITRARKIQQNKINCL